MYGFEGPGFWVCLPALSQGERCFLLQTDWMFPGRNQMKLAGAKLHSNKTRRLLQGAAPHGSRWWMMKCPLGSRGAENGWRSKSACETYHPFLSLSSLTSSCILATGISTKRVKAFPNHSTGKPACEPSGCPSCRHSVRGRSKGRAATASATPGVPR